MTKIKHSNSILQYADEWLSPTKLREEIRLRKVKLAGIDPLDQKISARRVRITSFGSQMVPSWKRDSDRQKK